MEYIQIVKDRAYRYYGGKYFGKLLLWCNKILHKYEDAEEVAADILYKFCNDAEVLNNFIKGNVDSHKGHSIEAIFYRRAIHMSLNRKKQQVTNIELNEELFLDVFFNNDGNNIDEIRKKQIISRINSLVGEEETRNVITYDILSFYFFDINDLTGKNYTYQEIGSIFGMTFQAVEKRLKRFYKRAKKILEKENL